MRIAIFSDNFYPELSGISDSLIALSEELGKRGHQVHFYVPRYSKKDHTLSNLEHEEIDLGPNIAITRFSSIFFGAGSGQGRLVIPYGLRYLQVKKFDPDVIHTQTFFGVGFEALIASRILNKPLVGTNHTAIKEFLRYNPIKAQWVDNLIVKYVNWYYSRCIIVTGPSRSVFTEMDKDGFHKRGIPLSNPIDINIFRPLPNREAIKKKFGIGDNAMVHTGRFAAERSIDVMVRALPLIKKEIPDVQFVLCGRGPAEKDLLALAEKLGVRDRVKIIGFVPQETLVEIYNCGALFAITSTADTQSMVLMQAMACGIPVIGVRARALPEYINDESGFVVEPGNPEALAVRAIELFKDKALQKKLGEGGRKNAEQYSVPEITSRWESIYADAVKLNEVKKS